MMFMLSSRRRMDSCGSGRRGVSVVGLRYFVQTLEVCLFLALACSSSVAFRSDRTIAQFAHTPRGPKDGAPSVVMALAQSADGYLWLGSPNGLYRFDCRLRALSASVGRLIPCPGCPFTFGPSQWRPLDRLSCRRDKPSEERKRHELYHPRRNARRNGVGLGARSGRDDLGCDEQRAVAVGTEPMEGRGERLEFPREDCPRNFSGSSRNPVGFYRGHAGFSSVGREAVSADGYQRTSFAIFINAPASVRSAPLTLTIRRAPRVPQIYWALRQMDARFLRRSAAQLLQRNGDQH
jgi:hypothetical protein